MIISVDTRRSFVLVLLKAPLHLKDKRPHHKTLPSSCLQVFGLHPNADITCQTNLTNETLNTIINIQPKDSGAATGETRETSVQRSANEMLDKLPPDYVPHEVSVHICINICSFD